jgi:DNA segregation ATPase FtsK/SpoIIIE, S-DNA-T family
MNGERKNRLRSEHVTGTLEIEEQGVQGGDTDEMVKKNAERKNKQRKVTTSEKKITQTEKPTDYKKRWERIKIIYHSEQTKKISGLLLILFSAYLSLAFISYFFTWDIDQDKVLGSAEELFLPETKIKNWLGKFGALTSHWFMYKGFGAASLMLVPVFFIYGLQKLTQKNLIKAAAFNARWLFLMVWCSLVFSFFFSEKLFFMGGGFGYFMGALISNYIGGIGLVALLVFAMLVFLVLTVNLSFKLPEFKSLQQRSESSEDEVASFEDFNEYEDQELTIEPAVLSPEEEAALLNFEVIKMNDEASSIVVKDLTDLETVIKSETPVAVVKTGEPELEITSVAKELVITEDENKASQLVEKYGEYDPTLDLGSYQFPKFDLLNDYGNIQSKVNQEELIANKNRILSTLKNYGIEIDKIMATVGPTVTLYEIVPAAGIRISKIKNLEDDIALSLAALGIRIIAPIPGKGTIGIEVPNQTPEMVPMKNILSSEKFNNCNFELPIALGRTISNEIFIADLAKMPHLLMAGATGQGKSVGLNAVLVSLLYKKHPSQVKFVLVDPKKVELTLFNKIERHFLAKLPNSEDAIITDNTKVIHTLNSLCIEMDNRYALLQDAQVRNIKEYNGKFVNRKLNPNEGHKFLPYIILVVDEFADLIMTAGKEVETPIARLAQLARAVGIHLIIATQRPSVNIITGTIKANFPARIAFRVTSKIDSRTILDSGGAEQLIGRGDMLLSTGNDLIRIQCAFVDTPEVEKITEFIGNQRAYPHAFMLPEYVGEDGESGKEDVDLSSRDKMFDESARLIVQFQQGSASFLQRKLKLGYNRAGRIVDQLEAAGVIGPFEGSKAREVLVKDLGRLDEILQKLRNQ